MRKDPERRGGEKRRGSRATRWAIRLAGLVFALLWPLAMRAEERVIHTNPLNREPDVRAAYERFYTLDYDGALRGFQKIQQAHPDDPMAADYVLETVLFHQLYNLDLLDTTQYAHDGFLTGKHQVVEDKAFTDAHRGALRQRHSSGRGAVAEEPEGRGCVVRARLGEEPAGHLHGPGAAVVHLGAAAGAAGARRQRQGA